MTGNIIYFNRVHFNLKGVISLKGEFSIAIIIFLMVMVIGVFLYTKKEDIGTLGLESLEEITGVGNSLVGFQIGATRVVFKVKEGYKFGYKLK